MPPSGYVGIDLGCKSFSRQRAGKSLLIFDSESHRFQRFISDISGLDIQRHDNEPKIAVARVRDWLRTESGSPMIPGGASIYHRYIRYRRALPRICSKLRLDLDELPFVDFSHTIRYWISLEDADMPNVTIPSSSLQRRP